MGPKATFDRGKKFNLWSRWRGPRQKTKETPSRKRQTKHSRKERKRRLRQLGVLSGGKREEKVEDVGGRGVVGGLH